MGDRRIVVLESDQWDADLAVYTHWGGSELPKDLARIIASNYFVARRGDDPAYAARILIDQLTKDARDNENGYGVFPIPKGADPTRLAEDEYGEPLRVQV